MLKKLFWVILRPLKFVNNLDAAGLILVQSSLLVCTGEQVGAAGRIIEAMSCDIGTPLLHHDSMLTAPLLLDQ